MILSMDGYTLIRHNLHPFLSAGRRPEAAIRLVHGRYVANVDPLTPEVGQYIREEAPIGCTAAFIANRVNNHGLIQCIYVVHAHP